MYNEGGYILLAVSAANECIDILRPTFDVALPFDAGIVRTFFKIHLLRAESEFVHPLPRTAENDVYHRAVFRFNQSLVGVFDPATAQYVRYPFRDIAARVDGANLASGHNLEVQMFAGGVVVALAHGVLLRLFAAITQVFVALGGGDPFRYLNIENLFCICHTVFVLFRTIPRVPACCLLGHFSLRRQSAGVLGSPFPLFSGRRASPDACYNWKDI